MLSGRSGDMIAELPHGLFVLDTRVLAGFELQLDGHPLEPLAVELVEPFAATFVGRAGAVAGEADSSVVVFRRRHIGDGMRERIRIANHGLDEVALAVELRCTCDFADLFEVKERRGRPPGATTATWSDGELRFTRRDVVTKQVAVRFSEPAALEPERARGGCGSHRAPRGRSAWRWSSPSTAPRSNRGSDARVRIGRRCPASAWLAGGRWSPRWSPTTPPSPRRSAGRPRTSARCGSSTRSIPTSAILAAGAPWFMTVFGRDSLLTAWMTLIADPSLAAGRARDAGPVPGPGRRRRDRGGTRQDPPRDAVRVGVGLRARARRHLLRLGRRHAAVRDAARRAAAMGPSSTTWSTGCSPTPIGRSTGSSSSATATATATSSTPSDHRTAWPTRAGRTPGTRSASSTARWPRRRSRCARCRATCTPRTSPAPTSPTRPATTRPTSTGRRRPSDLRQRFNEDFWLDERGWYALGLDADKRPIDALTSNIGHCLWTGIVDPELAAVVAERLMSSELFSGWGVRTLATSMARLQPGQLPQRLGLAARQRHLRRGAGPLRVRGGGAADHRARSSTSPRPSEGGCPSSSPASIARSSSVPAAYPTSCSPQAWAAASPAAVAAHPAAPRPVGPRQPDLDRSPAAADDAPPPRRGHPHR